MEKYLTKTFAKKLLRVGLILSIVGLIVTNLGIFSIYEVAEQCLADSSSNCPGITWQEYVGKAGSYVAVIGYYTLLIGAVNFLVAHVRKK